MVNGLDQPKDLEPFEPFRAIYGINTGAATNAERNRNGTRVNRYTMLKIFIT